jgi:hypothetical protein
MMRSEKELDLRGQRQKWDREPAQLKRNRGKLRKMGKWRELLPIALRKSAFLRTFQNNT